MGAKERRERENQLSQDFEAAKKLEKESLDITERIQVWKHFTAALPDERTARIDELRKYAMKRIENLERYKATGQNLPREMKKDKRFIAYDDGTVLDTKTNLMWAAKDNGSNLNWTKSEKLHSTHFLNLKQFGKNKMHYLKTSRWSDRSKISWPD